jgi:amino acid transporter
MPAFLLTTEFLITSALFLASLGGMGLMAWLDKRPKQNLTPSLIPKTPLLLIFGFVALVAAVHLVNLAGVHTGR